MAQPITTAQAVRAALDAEYMRSTVESTNYSELTPDGTLKRTITGMNEDIDSIISNANDALEDLNFVGIVYDTVVDLIAYEGSTGVSIQLKERSLATYIIQSVGFVAQDGDIALTSGQVAELQLQAVNDVRWWGVNGEGSDETVNFNSARVRCATAGVWLTGFGLTVGISSRMYLAQNTKIRDITFQAVGTGWADNLADADAGVEGKPIISVANKGTNLKNVFIDCGITTLDATNQDVAASGILYLDGSNESDTDSVTVIHYLGYGIWTKGKHGQSFHDNVITSQWLWGEKGWFDASARTAYGWVNSTGDFMVGKFISYYNKSNLHIIAGAYTTQWSSIHPFNGSDEVAALDNITQTGGSGQVIDNVYLDSGFITLTDTFNTQFGIIRVVHNAFSSCEAVFRLITSVADETAKGLSVGHIVLTLNNPYVYSTTGMGSWAEKKHITRSIQRPPTSTSNNSVIVMPQEGHYIDQTRDADPRYIISRDGGTTVVDNSAGLLSLRKENFGPTITTVTNGNIGEVVFGSYKDTDHTVQHGNSEIITRMKFVGGNGTDLGTTTNTAVGKSEILTYSDEEWTPTAMGTRMSFGVTKTGTTNVVYPLVISDGAVGAYNDDTYSCGRPWAKWTVVYATDGAVNTSDGRLKEEQRLIDDSVLDAWANVPKKQYKWVSSIEEKGSDKARWHVGVIAQDVVKAFKDAGLDAYRYAVLCFDKWDEQEINHEPVLDENGATLKEAYTESIPAGNRFGIRYDQASQLDVALERRERKKLEERIEALEI